MYAVFSPNLEKFTPDRNFNAEFAQITIVLFCNKKGRHSQNNFSIYTNIQI